ncbi:hypothetical protein ACET3Z_006663 [Daucus carota]
MQISGVKPDSGTMASLLPAVTNTSIENVMVVNDMFVNHKESLVSWNVMIAVYVNNSMPTKAIDIYLQMEFSKMEPDAITLASQQDLLGNRYSCCVVYMAPSWRSNEGISVLTVVASCYRGGYHVEDAFANIIKVFKAPKNAVKFQAEVRRKNTMCTLPV